MNGLSKTVDGAESLSLAFAVGTVADGIAGLEAHMPDVLLVDLRLPDGDGTDVLVHMRHYHRDTVAMVISVLGDEANVINAIKAGAKVIC